jgi:hypothetical protein
MSTAEHVTAIFIDVCVHKADVEADPCVACNCALQKQRDRIMAPITSKAEAWIQMLLQAILTFFGLLSWLRYSTLCCGKNSHMLSWEIQLSGRGNWTNVILFHVVPASRVLYLLLFHHDRRCLFCLVSCCQQTMQFAVRVCCVLAMSAYSTASLMELEGNTKMLVRNAVVPM